MTKLIDLKKRDSKLIEECAEAIKDGKLVVLPTETVYGIGANALDVKAVRRIFEIKKRNKNNPLIVLVSDFDMLDKIAYGITDIHQKLIDKFWPGPLTIIFNRKNSLPDDVTGNLDTIGVRIPGNEIVLDIIRKAKVPITAPSANVSGKLSIIDPKLAYQEFNGKVDFIVDGGISDIGVESTIVKVDGNVIYILRRGKILPEDIEKLGFSVRLSDNIPSKGNKHYSIGKKAILVTGSNSIDKITNYIDNHSSQKIGVIGFDEHYTLFTEKVNVYIKMGSVYHYDAILKNLFNTLNEAKEADNDVFLIECLEEHGIGKLVMDKFRAICDNEII